MTLIEEHSVKLDICVPKGDVNSKMETFYNPVMVSNRNISIILLGALNQTGLRICDPMAGSGIRALRFLQELNPTIISKLVINDVKADFAQKFEQLCLMNKVSIDSVEVKKEELEKKDLEKKNLRKGDLEKNDLDKRESGKKVEVRVGDANQLLNTERGFDYIDIDPFGTPNPFLASAVAKISRKGILAITATDTAALTGTYPKVTQRKYWATSLKNYMMHEIGLRILIRKVQLQGIQFEKALIPVMSYHKDHYFRIYCRAAHGKEKCDELIHEHEYLLWCNKCLQHERSKYNFKECCSKAMSYAGPLFTGKLGETELLARMIKSNTFASEQELLEKLSSEVAHGVGFYDVHSFCKMLKIDVPKLDLVLAATNGTRTHFCDTGIKTSLNAQEFKQILLNLHNKKESN